MRSLGTVVLLLLALQGAAESPRRYIVELAPNVRIRGDAEARGERRFRVRREFSRVLNGAAIELAEGVSIDEIKSLPYVTRVTPDAIVTAYGARDGTATASKTALPPHSTAAGAGIVVAVIDTGVDRFHPALTGKVVGGWDFVNDDDDAMDDHSHGTHVAGIIAASSPAMTGVAPGVSLLAYKVLDRTGKGDMSAVVAGIDRAVADGADVINLSLGTGGHPDDPMARAVDAATAAGVVVVVAAGSTGEFHTIGSPGVAATAITVGAWANATTIADFSSRGPANRSGAIKPELLAPGVSILSTVLNGKFGHSSGTSMAAPYVAGLAALLRAEHGEWTPARVKSALVSTALPIATEEVMSQGTGRVDVDRAFASVITVAPVQINFGLDGDVAPLWSSTRTLALRNDGGETRTIRLLNESALTIRMTPEEVTLAPGESRDVEVAIDIDHRLVGKPQTRSFSFGGWILLDWEDGDARVPWSFVRAARAVVTYPEVRPLVLWNTGERYGSLALEANGVEALLEPAVYDMVAVTEHEGDVRVFVSEEQAITGEVMFALSAADAKHEVRLDGVDSRGLPLESPAVRARFVLPDASVVLPSFGRMLHTSSFSPKYALLATESAFDERTTTMHVVQHAPARGIDEDVTLRNQPSEFLGDEVRLRFPTAVPREIRVMPRDWSRRPGDVGSVPQWFTTTSNGSVWTMRVLMTPEHAGDVVSGVQISAAENAGGAYPEIITPMIRRDGESFFAAWGFSRPPVADTTLDFGGGAPLGVTRLVATPDSVRGFCEVRGEGGELLRGVATLYRITNANDVEVAKGDVAYQSLFSALPGAGQYRAELRMGESTIRMQFTTTTATAATLPSVTSFAVSHDSLVFSAADFEGETYRRVPEDLTKVFFRRRGGSTWVQLTALRIDEEEGTYEELVRLPYGNVYRVDLADALRISRDIEIAIELTDTDGNSTTSTTPVVLPAARRRAVRR